MDFVCFWVGFVAGGLACALANWALNRFSIH